MKLKIQAGTTNRIARIFVQDVSKSDGSGLTGLTASTAGLAWYYSRVGDTGSTAVTPAAGTVGTFTGGGLVAVDGTNMPGVYEIGIPNAAVAAGSTAVHLILRGATNMAPVPIEIELDAVNYQSNTAFLASVPAVSGTVAANVTQVGGNAVPATSVNGLLKVDVAYLNGAPATASSGAIDANLISVNGTAFAGPNTPTSSSAASLTQIQGELDTRGLTTATTTLVTTNLDAKVSTRSTYTGGPVASVTAPVTVGTVQDKTGYALAGSGLDAISVESGVNARQALSPILAASAGVILGAGTGTIVVKGGNVSTTRITASTDNAGDRTGVVLNLPA